MKKTSIAIINKKLNEDSEKFILNCEGAYKSQIQALAYGINRWGDTKPIILLSGPSGSGKTTTALMLDECLEKLGRKTHTISMDDYFFSSDRPHSAYDENGNIDYESPYRLDINLLNKHMLKLANCEEIEVPQFNFREQKRSKQGIPLKRQKGDFVIFEGIHALNPDVTGMTDGIANGVYVSVRTRLETKSGAVLHPSQIRLMRRIIRDKLFRGRQPIDTLSLFNSVERGENLYIMPYKNRAEYSIDTFIPYEVSVYKAFLENDLNRVLDGYGDCERFAMIPKVLDELVEIGTEKIPQNSLVREFIGGSSFEY